MPEVKSVADWMAARGITLARLIEATGLDARVVVAIASCRYTPSPAQRQRFAAAMGISAEQVAWGHKTEVTHLHGHGPQFGRTP